MLFCLLILHILPSPVIIGARDASAYWYQQPLTGSLQHFFESSTNGFPNYTATTTQGAWTVSRTGNNANGGLYLNGSSTAVQALTANATSATVAQDFYLSCLNDGGAANFFSTDEISAAWFGAGLTGSQVAQLHTRINTYMTAFGVNVY